MDSFLQRGGWQTEVNGLRQCVQVCSGLSFPTDKNARASLLTRKNVSSR